jgi:hypothetical protein
MHATHLGRSVDAALYTTIWCCVPVTCPDRPLGASHSSAGCCCATCYSELVAATLQWPSTGTSYRTRHDLPGAAQPECAGAIRRTGVRLLDGTHVSVALPKQYFGVGLPIGSMLQA